MKLGERTLWRRVIDRVERPLLKHRLEDETNDQIKAKAREIIQSWTNLELLDAISFEIEDAEEEANES